MNNETRYLNSVGTFECRIKKPINGWIGQTDKGTFFIRLPLVVIDDGPDQGREIVWRGWCSEAAMEYTVRALTKALDWDGDIGLLYDGGVDHWEGRQVQITTKAEDYEGKRMIKIEWLNPSGGGAGTRIAVEKVTSLLSAMGSKAKAYAKAVKDEQGSPPSPAPVSAQTTHKADGLPF